MEWCLSACAMQPAVVWGTPTKRKATGSPGRLSSDRCGTFSTTVGCCCPRPCRFAQCLYAEALSSLNRPKGLEPPEPVRYASEMPKSLKDVKKPDTAWRAEHPLYPLRIPRCWWPDASLYAIPRTPLLLSSYSPPAPSSGRCPPGRRRPSGRRCSPLAGNAPCLRPPALPRSP